jgi:pimeloyl-ACP methyl ester carboxylesterase
VKPLTVGTVALLWGTALTAPVEAQDTTGPLSPAALEQLVRLDTLWLTFLRQRNARDYAITTPNGIQDDRYVTLGGIEQWISIRGEDRGNPVILFVHGGPGDATSLYGWAFLRSWFKRFTVVQWDQRGAGKTYARSGPSTPDVAIARIAQDGLELADSLRRMLHKEKIVLVGHSFGSVLGLQMVKARPDLFYAYVGTGQIGASSSVTLATAYRQLLHTAKQRGERVAVSELVAIGPPPWRDRHAYGVQHKWGNLIEHADAFLNASFALQLTAPHATLQDVNDTFQGEGFSGDKLVPQINTIDSTLYRGTFAVPMFVFQGAGDLTAPPSLAESFVRAIHAPKKAFVTIPGGGHFVVFTKPDAFLGDLVTHVGFAK